MKKKHWKAEALRFQGECVAWRDRSEQIRAQAEHARAEATALRKQIDAERGRTSALSGQLSHVGRLARDVERERCAQVVESMINPYEPGPDADAQLLHSAAARIRAVDDR